MANPYDPVEVAARELRQAAAAARIEADKENPRAGLGGNYRLTREQVRSVRCEYSAGAIQSELAAKYSVSQSCISSALSWRSWAWLDDPDWKRPDRARGWRQRPNARPNYS